MANKVQQTENDIMVETKGQLEVFFDKYGNKLLWVLAVVTVVAVAAFAIYNISVNSNKSTEAEAGAALAVVIDAVGGAEEYVTIVETYEGSNAANTAAYLAGAAYLKANDLENAKKYLEMYKNIEGEAGEIINALVYSLRGDLAVEQNDLAAAVELFRQAMTASNDPISYTDNAQKLALVYEAMGDKAQAQQCYKDIVKKYPEQERNYAKYIFE